MSDQFHEYILRGQEAATKGAAQEAEACFRAAAQVRPDAIEAMRGLGNALVTQKRFEEAEAVWRRAVELDEQHADNHQMLGLVCLRRRKIADAKNSLMRALSLNPRLGEAAFNLGRIAHVSGNSARAADYFAQAVDVKPSHIMAHAALVQTLTELSRIDEAVAAGTTALRILEARSDIQPAAYNVVRHHLALAYRRRSDMSAMAVCYRAIVAADPTDAAAQHLLAAAEGVTTQEHATGFAKTFFDNLAADFDTHLTERLQYRAPALIAEGLRGLRPNVSGFDAVLDVGCGTGLMGVALRAEFALQRLVGIDLSEKMLLEAQKRGLYHELVAGDAVTVMGVRSDMFDLIVAADVMIYVGDLMPVFTEVARLLKPGGMFAFTTEISAEAEVELSANGHYHHHPRAVDSMMAAAGFTLLQATEAPLRKEANVDVMGRYVYVTKP
jgi:predicted TPR repeat methyltransferase